MFKSQSKKKGIFVFNSNKLKMPGCPDSVFGVHDKGPLKFSYPALQQPGDHTNVLSVVVTCLLCNTVLLSWSASQNLILP